MCVNPLHISVASWEALDCSAALNGHIWWEPLYEVVSGTSGLLGAHFEKDCHVSDVQNKPQHLPFLWSVSVCCNKCWISPYEHHPGIYMREKKNKTTGWTLPFAILIPGTSLDTHFPDTRCDDHTVKDATWGRRGLQAARRTTTSQVVVKIVCGDARTCSSSKFQWLVESVSWQCLLNFVV